MQFEKRNGGPRSAARERPVKAEILMFTGVRYERDAPNLPTKPSASPGAKRKRG
ncbi:MAG: hypothetical protein ABIO40_02670 [Devosia sp.]